MAVQLHPPPHRDRVEQLRHDRATALSIAGIGVLLLLLSTFAGSGRIALALLAGLLIVGGLIRAVNRTVVLREVKRILTSAHTLRCGRGRAEP